MAQIDIIMEDQRWDDAGLETQADKACAAVSDALSLDDGFEISILGCDDARISALNTDFRGKNAATNVLSWPSVDLASDVAGGAPNAPDREMPELGDIAISYDTCAREAAEQGKSMEHHVTHLLVHGTLHLLGYDHQNDEDATLMEGLETQILAKLGIEDPYS